mgnify:CR=1 FL=1
MQININANANDINVFVVMPSLKKYPTSKAYVTIPTPNPTNLAGHSKPSKPSTVYLVAHINR